MHQRVYILVGPTASGKTDVAVKLANKLNAEIINADSRQIYKEVSIGTAKPFFNSKNKKKHSINGVQHFLIDICSLKDEFSAGRFVEESRKAMLEIRKQKKEILITGGTGLYIKALIDGIVDIPSIDKSCKDYVRNTVLEQGLNHAQCVLKNIDKDTFNKIDINNPRRIQRALEVYYSTGIPLSQWHKYTESNKDLESVIFGLRWERDVLNNRIEKRADLMIEKGFIDEVKFLLEKGFSEQLLVKAGIGYVYIAQYINKEITLDDAVSLLKRDTKRYAKRQMTWFNKDKRIKWINIREPFDAEQISNHIYFGAK